MIDFQRFQAEAVAWGISLAERFALESLTQPSLKRLGEFNDADHEEFEFRSRVAEILADNNLAAKAKRYIDCGRMGYVLECTGEEGHQFFSPLYCDLRFCVRCAPRRFARLYEKHVATLQHIRRHPVRGFRLREITLTSANTGSLTSGQIKRFNKQIKATLRRLMKNHSGWGAIWVDEVGFNNTNLHAHILIYCPYIQQSDLVAVWQEISDNKVAWINQAHVFGPKALLHLLKYVSKPPADSADLVGLLEVAFDKTRRVHALGLFYKRLGVSLSSGRKISCDMVVAGVGASPVTELFAKSGLAVENGITVNEYLETNLTGIFAAGDVANYVDAIFDKRRRVEHWDNAVSQGQHWAGVIRGERRPFLHVPYFFSDVFDLSYELWGDSEGATQIITRGEPSSSSFSIWWLKRDCLIATFIMNRPDEERQCAPEWIKSKQNISADRLKDQNRPIQEAV